ncbi:MAG: hypothetical protein ACLQME_24940 [Alphaproteobacteria bacterium]
MFDISTIHVRRQKLLARGHVASAGNGNEILCWSGTDSTSSSRAQFRIEHPGVRAGMALAAGAGPRQVALRQAGAMGACAARFSGKISENAGWTLLAVPVNIYPPK